METTFDFFERMPVFSTIGALKFLHLLWKEWRQLKIIQETPTTPISKLKPRDTYEIKGRVVSSNQEQSIIDYNTYAWYNCRVNQWSGTRGNKDLESKNFTSKSPMVVRDQSGDCMVLLSMKDSIWDFTNRRGDASPELRRMANFTRKKVQYIESFIKDGDTLYVYGQV